MLTWLTQKHRELSCWLAGHWYDNVPNSIFDYPHNYAKRFHCIYCGQRQPGTETFNAT